jgi:hypothetical protein
MRSLQWIAVLAAVLLPAQGFSAVPSLNNLTVGDYDKIVREFSANFSYSSVTPASSLGGVWGFEIGAVGGLTKSPELLTLVKKTGSSYDQDKLPHGGALVRVGAPFGLTGELVIFPKMKISDLSIGQYGGAAQWTITDLFLTDFPVTMAVKGFFSKTSMDYTQSLNNSTTGNQPVDATITYDDTLLGAQFLVSKSFLVFEPYVGLGYVRSTGDLSVSAVLAPNASLFPGQGVGNSISSKPTSSQLLAGLDIRLAVFSLGAEYQRAFGTDTVNGRLSFRF